LATQSPWKELYPVEFDVDALAGMKYIYSEAILPENEHSERFLDAIRRLEKNLTGEDGERNRISQKVWKFILPSEKHVDQNVCVPPSTVSL
jgi:5'-3' exonuclease